MNHSIIKKDTPISLDNAADLLPLIEKQSGFKVAVVDSPKGLVTYTVDGRPCGLRFPDRPEALRSACRLLLGRSGDVVAFLDDVEAKLSAKCDRCAKGCSEKLCELRKQNLLQE